ncbi:signal transduction protein [Oscillochloris trichoides DG-6]|uniref:Signal transduction protein n=1 Tax=Oscillochloris trichoides DG-6 TaxID=765420 RepID=E1IGR4_9CHLR|nr:SUMF1/EgtB/PvdO family nonheme iron enzyme [Oscillochloris trichoides]EFO79651.1 signal transduction protein [Oscillochloris trichoides DG-6]
MSDDLSARLTRLRRKHANESDPEERADLAAAIEALEQKIAAQQPAPVHHNQTINNSTVGVGVAGHVYGHIFINGKHDTDSSKLIFTYLNHVARTCDVMPLQGVSSERERDDTLRLGLDQVYTQLATTQVVDREPFAVADLSKEALAAYLQAHTGAACMPAQRRTTFRSLEPHCTEGMLAEYRSPDLEQISAADLLQMVATWEGDHPTLVFQGPQIVTEALAAQRHVVLLGEPGGGKSTVLRYLARHLARAGIEEGYDLAAHIDGWGELGRLLPIVVPLLPLARLLQGSPKNCGTASDLWNYLVDYLQPKGTATGLADAVWAEVEAGHVMLLLDGLDEVAGAESRLRVVQAISAFATEHPTCRIVVSCRVRAYDAQINPENRHWHLPGWPTVTLADLTPAQMEHFVAAWYGAVAMADPNIAAQRAERVAELRTALQARPDLRELGKRPLLLTIMALVHLRQRNLPEDRASLYRECVEILLGRWELRGKEETEYKALMDYIGLPGIEVKALRPLLAEVAFTAHQALSAQNPGVLSSATLHVLVQKFLDTKGHPNPYAGAQRFLEYTDYRAGLIHASGAAADYQFAHLTFQEYLAGLALVGAERPVQAILDRRHDERWRVPIFLGIGHAVGEGLPSLFRDLLDELTSDAQTPQGQRDLILAAELAADVRWERLEGPGFKRLKTGMAHDLAAVVEGTLLPAAERVRAGELLAGLGDPRPGVCTLPPVMVEIAGGSFVIGITETEANQWNEVYGHDWASREINNQSLVIMTFEMARYLTTNAQFKHFIDADGYNPEQPWWEIGKQRRGQKHIRQPLFWNDSRFGIARPNHPVVGVSWYEATAFCVWLTQHLQDGYVYRLPSEAEWEFAARGVERRMYAWGNAQPDSEQVNFNTQYDGTTTVGCFSAGATPNTELLDMAGNVWEWTCSKLQFYPYNPYDGREDISSLVKTRFVMRGGAWFNQSINLRATSRGNYAPESRNQRVGFRVARQRVARG